MNIFGLITQYSDSIFKFLYNIQPCNIDNKTKGIILILLHNISILLIVIYIVVGPINYIYYTVIIFLIIIFIINILYKGCPLIKIERKYINNNKWYGAYHLLELIGIKPNKSNIFFLSYMWVFVLSFFIYNRYNYLF